MESVEDPPRSEPPRPRAAPHVHADGRVRAWGGSRFRGACDGEDGGTAEQPVTIAAEPLQSTGPKGPGCSPVENDGIPSFWVCGNARVNRKRRERGTEMVPSKRKLATKLYLNSSNSGDDLEDVGASEF